jgi:hypothetical protein
MLVCDWHVRPVSMNGSLHYLTFFFRADLRPEPVIVTTKCAAVLLVSSCHQSICFTCHQQLFQQHRLGRMIFVILLTCDLLDVLIIHDFQNCSVFQRNLQFFHLLEFGFNVSFSTFLYLLFL